MSEKSKNIYQRILAVMAEVDYISKDGKTGAMGKIPSYNFASHDKVTAVMHKAFVKHAIVCIPSVKTSSQNGNRTEIMLQVSFINPDDPKDCVCTTAVGYGIDGGDKGPGKAVSYAFKYALLKMFCLETGDDPDTCANACHEAAEKTVNEGLLTRAQLEAISSELIDHDKIRAAILQGYNIDKVSQLPKKDFEKVLQRISQHKQQKA